MMLADGMLSAPHTSTHRPGALIRVGAVTVAALVAGTAALLPATANAEVLGATFSLQLGERVTKGDTIALALDASQLDDLYAFEFELGFDPTLVQLQDDSAVYPDGGFDATTTDEEAGLATLVHTRLGTSPGLDGDLRTVALHFTALSEGEAAFTLVSGAIVDTSGVVTELEPTSIEPAATVISAASTPPPASTPSPTPSESPADDSLAPSSSSPPVDGEPAQGADNTSDLSSTASTVGLLAMIGVIALGAVAAGIWLFMRRKGQQS